MPRYVHLAKMTQEGAANIKQHPAVYADWGRFADSIGAKVVCAVGCFGEYDYVVIADYPDEKAALKGAAFAAIQGMVRSQTLPAFPIEEFFEAVSDLPD
jgi:uncharacterized protein with GYD domain